MVCLTCGWLACSAAATDILAEQRVNKYVRVEMKGGGHTAYNRSHVNTATGEPTHL